MNNPATDKQYVYKYIDQFGRVVYVGITNNIKKRVAEHKHDKLGELKKPTVMYFSVKYRYDAEMLETYLINCYGTGKHFNVKKRDRGNVSFLGNPDALPWIAYDGKDKDIEPFVVSGMSHCEESNSQVLVEEREVIKYIGNQPSDEQIIKDFHRDKEEIDDYLECEKDNSKKIVKALMLALDNNHPFSRNKKVPDSLISEGIRLHTIRIEIIEKLLEYNSVPPTERDTKYGDKLFLEAAWISREISNHEQQLKLVA